MAAHTPMSPPPTTTTSLTVPVEAAVAAAVAAVVEVARPRFAAAPPLKVVPSLLAVALAEVRAKPRSAPAARTCAQRSIEGWRLRKTTGFHKYSFSKPPRARQVAYRGSTWQEDGKTEQHVVGVISSVGIPSRHASFHGGKGECAEARAGKLE